MEHWDTSTTTHEKIKQRTLSQKRECRMLANMEGVIHDK